MTETERPKIKRRRLVGTVVSDKMQKTVVVEIARRKLHSLYRKQYRQSTRIKAHDEASAYKAGDKVVVEETRPLAKGKRWKVLKRA